jgi:pantoate--beta-alanine ligase
MNLFSSPQHFLTWRRSLSNKKSVGFVPTMGALHEGHLSLVRQSIQENDVTIVSIFVNPIQFGPKEDLKRYPRPLQKDRRLLAGLKVDGLFAPSVKSMIGQEILTKVSVHPLNEFLCGAPQFRGHSHFDGVATIVAKLFNIVSPQRAYFGLKDFQQVRVIEQMVKDLNIPVEIVRCPIVRERDGLAMSSRNQYLSPRERTLAPYIYRSLQSGRKLLRSHPNMSLKAISSQIKNQLKKIPEFKIEYIEFVDPQSLEGLRQKKGAVLLAAAVRLGTTRLIDNLLIK